MNYHLIAGIVMLCLATLVSMTPVVDAVSIMLYAVATFEIFYSMIGRTE